MALIPFLRPLLLAAGALVLAACASAPDTAAKSLDERYFEREANNYLKFEHEGQVVYCQNSRAATLVPYKMCLTEAALRARVETTRRNRNAVVRGGPQYVGTVPGG